MASYKVTIEKTETTTAPKTEYQKVSDKGNPQGDGPVYDYVTNPAAVQTSTSTVFSQVLEDDKFDMTAVVKAINRI